MTELHALRDAYRSDKAALLARFAAALHFPDWFGHNWDALSDCLTDLSWLPARHYRVELAQPQALRTAAPETLDTALEILGEAAEFGFGLGQGGLDGEEAGHHALHIAIHRRMPASEGNRRDA